MSLTITTLENGWRVQCCAIATDAAAARIFSFQHATEGFNPYWELLTTGRARSST